MDIVISNPSDSVLNIMRRAGYHFDRQDSSTGDDSYIARLSGAFYPRFHVYVRSDDKGVVLRLHLDQKRPSYPGSHAHNAEYDGDVVEREGERLKQLFEK